MQARLVGEILYAGPGSSKIGAVLAPAVARPGSGAGPLRPGGARPAEAWAKIVGPLRRRLCEEWDWSRARQDARFENDVDLAAAVLAALATRALDLPIDVDLYLIAVIVVKRGLDQLCAAPT